MPGFDRTGPEGQGPMTGRKMGRCNPNSQSEREEKNIPDQPERGLAQRRGRGASRPNLGIGSGKGLARGEGFGRRR